MPNRPVLEICVESVDHAVAAERGGADRIELCADLASGGTTPSAELMYTVRRQLRIPIHVLIRPRPGDFCYSDRELEMMRDDIHAAQQFGMDGVVLGILQKNDRVDVERTKDLVKLAQPLPVTFHRAFDASDNLETSLEEVVQTGATRILTSAGQPRATDGLQILKRLVRAAGKRILIMPCGGINSDKVASIVNKTLAREIHSSAGTSGNGDFWQGNNDSGLQFGSFEEKVAKLVSRLSDVSEPPVG